MAYTFEQVFAADPANPANIASNAAITIYQPGDPTETPLVITDPSGGALANPIIVNANGFGSAFMADIDRVAWSGGGFSGFFTSYEGMKNEAVDARTAAQEAATTAGAEAAAVATAAIGTANSAATSAAASAASAASNASASATAAANSAALVAAPADAAISAAVSGPTSATTTALKAIYALKPDNAGKPVGKGELIINVKDYGAKGDGSTDDTTALNAALAAGDIVLFPKGVYRTSGPVQRSGGAITILGQPGAIIRPLATYAGGVDRDILRVFNPTGPVVIDGITVDGNSTELNGGAGFADWTNYIGAITVLTAAAAPLSSVTVRRCRVYNFPSSGIAVQGGDNILIENNWVSDGMQHPIFAARSSAVPTAHVVIRNNRCEGRGNVGTNPLIGGIGILVQKVEKVEITGNQIYNTGDTGTKTEGCNDVLYRGNMVQDAGKDGIKVQGYTTDVSQVYRAVVEGNIVRRINAWRTDGSGLILLHNLKQGVVANNVVEGGGTRVADAIRCMCETAGFPFADITIIGNVATNIAGAGVKVAETANTNQNLNISVIGNRLAGPILVGSKGGGDYKIANNTVHNDGTLDTVNYGVNVDKMVNGSADVHGNTIADYLGGVFVTLSAGATVRAVRIADNIVRDCKDWGARVDNFDGTSGALDVLEIVRNEFINTSADGATKTAVMRIGVGQLSIGVAKVSNVYRQIGAGTISSPLQINGSTYPIGLLDYTGNTTSGTFSFRDINGETAITRIAGYARTAAPTWGTWVAGDYVANLNPTETGTAAAKYVVKGWTCVVSGSPGTWVQDRALTGN